MVRKKKFTKTDQWISAIIINIYGFYALYRVSSLCLLVSVCVMLKKKSPHSEYNCCIFYSNVFVELDLNVIKSDQFCVIFDFDVFDTRPMPCRFCH